MLITLSDGIHIIDLYYLFIMVNHQSIITVTFTQDLIQPLPRQGVYTIGSGGHFWGSFCTDIACETWCMIFKNTTGFFSYKSHIMRKTAFCISAKKQRCRTAALSSTKQADQSFCSCPFLNPTFNPLAFFCGCTAWFVSDLVRYHKDRFPRHHENTSV